tara:strand:- start:719 stop:1039 length:321 start_codon:yes stop_codon:yes gene_type:complete
MGKLSNAKKLTDIEKYSIQGMSQNGLDVTKIAEALSRAEELVVDYLAEIEKCQTVVGDNLMLGKTASGKDGVTIMTQAASEKADSSRSEGTPETTGKSAYVHYIKE